MRLSRSPPNAGGQKSANSGNHLIFWTVVVGVIGLVASLLTTFGPARLDSMGGCSEGSSAACSMLWLVAVPVGILAGIIWLVATALAWPLLVPLSWLLPPSAAFCLAATIGGAALGATIGFIRRSRKQRTAS